MPSSSLMMRRPPRSPLFPYTTLFRSRTSIRARTSRTTASSTWGTRSPPRGTCGDRKSTRLNSSHGYISYAFFFFNDAATPEISPLSLHDALPISNIDPDPDFPHYCEFYLGNQVAPAGYVWVFPKDECTANVGIGVSLNRPNGKTDIKMYLDRWIAADARFRRAQFLDMVTGGVSTSPPLPETVGNGIAIVGDAARMIDPITGRGIRNGCRAGRILGEVLGTCAQTGDFSKEALQAYEKGWRKVLEEQLWRNWVAKNKLATLTDASFDKIIDVLATANLTKLSVHRILIAIKERYPELLKEFEELI